MAVQLPEPPDQSAPVKKSYSSLFTDCNPPQVLNLSTTLDYYKGFPAVSFTNEEIHALAKPYQSALVGKFEGFRPPLPELRRRMDTIGFKGSYKLSLLHPKHVLIQFALETDYQRCWLKRSWNLGTAVMKIIMWTPEWSPEAESPIAPVWVELFGLPIHFFAKSSLQRITRHLGNFIKLDVATEKMTRPSVAKISIAMNLLQLPPDRIWICTGEEGGFWQTINYLDKPDYCTKCSRIGHTNSECGRKKDKSIVQNPSIKNLSVWREVHRPERLGTSEAHPAVDSSEMIAAQSKQNQQTTTNSDEIVAVPATSPVIPIFPSLPPQENTNNEDRVLQNAAEQLTQQVEEKENHEEQALQINTAHAAEQLIQMASSMESTVTTQNHKENEGPPPQNQEETNTQGVGPTGAQTNNQLLTLSTNDFGPSKEKNAAELIQQCMSTEQQKLKKKKWLIMGDQFARPTEEEVDTQLIDEQEESQEDTVPREQHNEVIQSKNLDGQMMEEITNLNLAKGLQEDARPTAEEVEKDACQTEEESNAGTEAAHSDTVAIHVANTLSIPYVQVQLMDAIENHIAMERVQEIQMEALDLAEPRQKITKGHMELRKLDINATRMNELLHMDKTRTGVASRLRSKDQQSTMVSIESPLDYIEEKNESEHVDDTDEDTEEIDYMNEMAQQWEVNIGSSRRRALQTRRKANKIAARGNTLISRGKCYAYEVKRRGGIKF